mmetsp:Transcript_36950/g.48652  ORF Transcript_36950/g.48652 Transcript_36950/m.48652 type:complete len:829 (-) Transcript_36950:243-2729(-)
MPRKSPRARKSAATPSKAGQGAKTRTTTPRSAKKAAATRQSARKAASPPVAIQEEDSGPDAGSEEATPMIVDYRSKKPAAMPTPTQVDAPQNGLGEGSQPPEAVQKILSSTESNSPAPAKETPSAKQNASTTSLKDSTPAMNGVQQGGTPHPWQRKAWLSPGQDLQPMLAAALVANSPLQRRPPQPQEESDQSEPEAPSPASTPAPTLSPSPAAAPAPAPLSHVQNEMDMSDPLKLKEVGAAAGGQKQTGDPLCAASLPALSAMNNQQNQDSKILPPWLNPNLGINPMLPGGMVQLGPGIIPQKELTKLPRREVPMLPSGEPDPRVQFYDCRGKTALAALTEFCDKKKIKRPEFEFVESDITHGPQIFKATIKLCGMKWGWGESPSKAMARHLAANETLKLLVSSYNGSDCVIPGLDAAIYRTKTARGKGLKLTLAGQEGSSQEHLVGPLPDVVEDLGDGRKEFNYGPAPEWNQWTGLLNSYCQMMDLKMPTFKYETLECTTLAGKKRVEYLCEAEFLLDKPVNREVLDKVGENAVDLSKLDIETFEPKIYTASAQGTSKKDAQHRVSGQLVAKILPQCTSLENATEIINNMKKNKRACSRAKKRERQMQRNYKKKKEAKKSAMASPGQAQNSATSSKVSVQGGYVGQGSQDDDIDEAIDDSLSKMKFPSDVVLRRAVEEDCDDILKMIEELAAYEKEPDGVKIDAETLRKDGFGKQKHFYSLIAEREGIKVGFALFYIAYSTWEGRCVYLEDLYMREAQRNNGVGKHLLKSLAAIAQELDCARLSWQALDWNAPAHAFYQKIGAKLHPEWQNYRMYREDIAAFLEEP